MQVLPPVSRMLLFDVSASWSLEVCGEEVGAGSLCSASSSCIDNISAVSADILWLLSRGIYGERRKGDEGVLVLFVAFVWKALGIAGGGGGEREKECVGGGAGGLFFYYGPHSKRRPVVREMGASPHTTHSPHCREPDLQVLRLYSMGRRSLLRVRGHPVRYIE